MEEKLSKGVETFTNRSYVTSQDMPQKKEKKKNLP